MPRSSPSRTVATRRVAAKAPSAPSVFDHSHHAYHRRTLGQHGAHIMMLWIVLLSFGLAGALMILTVATRLQTLETNGSRLMDVEALIGQQEIRLGQLIEAVKQLTPMGQKPVVTTSTAAVPPMPVAGVPVIQPAVVSMTSPSGALSRGSISADGSKFAGYEDVKIGKKGVAVELLKDAGTRKERYIVIFGLSESTGVGTSFEKDMSVRWKDAKTIEYDVLVKVKNEWKKETREVQIFF